MERWILLLAALGTVTMTAPPGAATWYAAGSHEPDTTWDAGDGWMFLSPDTNASGQRVYFNAYESVTNQVSLNPNVGALGGRMPSPAAHWQVLLGVWKDCNRDGYIGLAESALREYRVELLPPLSPCPPFTSVATPVFNDGRWVTELLTLGSPDPCVWATTPPPGCPPFQVNPSVHYVNATMVWGDLGAPGANASIGSDCPTFPLPRGATSGSGHLLRYADCFAGRRGVAAFDEVVTTIDPQDTLGLRFGDAHAPQDSGSVLNVHFPVNAYGSPTTGRVGVLQRGSGDPAFSVFSCQSGTEYHPTPEEPLDNRSVDPTVQDPVADPRGTGSYWDGAEDGFEDAVGNCDATGSPGVFALLHVDAESAPAGVDPAKGRSRSNAYFTFYNGARGTRVGHVDDAAGTRAPLDAGAGVHRQAGARTGLGFDWETGPLWNAHTTFVGNLPPLAGASPTRGSVEPQAPTYWTFYARLGQADIARLDLALPSARVGVYGAEACGTVHSAGSPNRNGWTCDPTKWWQGEDGADIMPYSSQGQSSGKALAPRVGTTYQLRDVDCDDGRVAALQPGVAPGDGAFVGLAQLAGNACA